MFPSVKLESYQFDNLTQIPFRRLETKTNYQVLLSTSYYQTLCRNCRKRTFHEKVPTSRTLEQRNFACLSTYSLWINVCLYSTTKALWQIHELCSLTFINDLNRHLSTGLRSVWAKCEATPLRCSNEQVL